MANNPRSPKVGTQSVPLTLFSSWCTECNPSDLPEGLSPDTQNCQYLVGSVAQRGGLSNLFAFGEEFVGPNFPSTAVQFPLGNVEWINPQNVAADDGSYATLSMGGVPSQSNVPSTISQSGTSGDAWVNPANVRSTTVYATCDLTSTAGSHILSATNLGFNLPASATIKSLNVNFQGKSTGNGAGLFAEIFNNGVAIPPINGSVTLSPTTTNYSMFGPLTILAASKLSPAIVNNSGFGVRFQASANVPSLALLQATSGLGTSTAVTGTLPNVGVGNTLILSFDVFNQIFSTVSDNRGNTYQPTTSVFNGSHTSYVFYVPGTISGSTTFTINTTGHNSNSFVIWAFHEVSGIANAFDPDKISTNSTNASGSSFNTGTVNTTNAHDVIFSSMYDGNASRTLPSGYSSGTQFSQNISGGVQNIATAFRSVSATGSYSPTWGLGASTGCLGITVAFRLQDNNVSVNNLRLIIGYTLPNVSNPLFASAFGFALADDPIVGIEVGIRGHQIGTGTINVYAFDSIESYFGAKPLTLGSTDSRVVLGGPNDTWGGPFTPAQLNSSNFGIALFNPVFTSTVEWFIDAIDVTVYQAPSGTNGFTYTKTFRRQAGNLNLALTSNGVLWQEDIANEPNILNSVFEGILPGSFGKSDTFNNREYIALSDLVQGFDIPRQYDGTNLDRISQCGPGGAPSVQFNSTGYPIAASAAGLTQQAAFSIAGSTRFFLWSAGPGNISTPGSTLSFVFPSSFVLPAEIVVGGQIVLAGAQTMNGFDPNSGASNGGVANPASYTVLSVGGAIPGQSSYTGFTVQLTQTGFFNANPQSGTTVQATLATVTTTVAVPGVQIGSPITIAGATNASWDGAYTVIATLNGAQMIITDTSLTSGVATYAFTLVSGVTPTMGELVTVTNTNNGNGIFNLTSATIASATSSVFTVNIASPNIASAGETGLGLVNGTVFQFDPGVIIANSGGGTIAGTGNIAPGVRNVVCLFQTRNGYVTAPSPFYQFSVASGVNTLTVTNVPVGPPNVTQRIIAFTPANSSNYYYIPEPVTVNDAGVKTTYSATIIPDNVTTNASFTFTDDVLSAAQAIDDPGDNLFNLVELGPVKGTLKYNSRLLAWGELAKVQNFNNLSFNGGVSVNSSGGGGGNSTIGIPLGWTQGEFFLSGGKVVTSPAFGQSYQISNTSGSTQAQYGTIYQTAYQDQYGVNIINPNTAYGVRVTAALTNVGAGLGSGELAVFLFSPQTLITYGQFNVPFTSMGETLEMFTGTLLPLSAAFGSGTNPPVLQDLVLGVCANNIENATIVLVDRSEIFDLSAPVNQSIVRVSYVEDAESFDDETGKIDISGLTALPITNAFIDQDRLYIATESGLYETQDNGITEPSGWTVREISNVAGSVSVNGTDSGEEWRIMAGQPGLYLFWGGEPVKISQEIQHVWDLIDWRYQHTIWVKNDSKERLMQVAVPIPTPNSFMPKAPTNANPTSPNVILTMSYREMTSAVSIADSPPIHVSYSGKLTARELVRKWNFWTIPSVFGAALLRPDNTTPVVYCSGAQPKIYSVNDDITDDDGVAINSYYTTYGFVKQEAEQGLGIGSYRHIYKFMSMLISGEGSLSATVIPDNPASDWAQALLPFTLNPVPRRDTECPLQQEGQRLFVQFGTNALNQWWQMSKIVMTLAQAPHAPVTGLEGSQ
jgi:hypothetical protein